MIIDTANTELIIGIIYNQEVRGTPIEIIELKGGKAFALSQNAMAIYQASNLIDDPFSQGLIATIDIPDDFHLPATGPWIKAYKSGYVRLANNRVIVITPKSFRFYPDRETALYNKQLICELIHTGE